MKSSNFPQIKNAILLTSQNSETRIFTEAMEAVGIENIHCLQSTASVLKLANTEQIDLFICKWDNELHGDTVLQQIRDMEVYAETPFFLFADSFDADKVYLGIEFEALDFIVKPIDRMGIIQILTSRLQEFAEQGDIGNELFSVLSRSKLCYRFEQFNQGITIIDDFLETNLEDIRLLYQKALLLEKVGHDEEAIQLAQKVGKDDNYFVRTVQLIGKVYLKKGDLGKAIKRFEKARLLSPYNINRLLSLGECYYKIGDFDKSKERFSEAYQLDGQSKEAMEGISKTIMQTASPKKMVNEFASNYASPSDISLYNTMAIMLVKKERFSEANKMYGQALLLAENDPDLKARILFNLGLLNERRGKVEQATIFYNQSLKERPDFKKPKARLDVINERLNKGEKVSKQEKKQGLMHGAIPMKPADRLDESRLYQHIMALCNRLGKQSELDKMLDLIFDSFCQVIPFEIAVIAESPVEKSASKPSILCIQKTKKEILSNEEIEQCIRNLTELVLDINIVETRFLEEKEIELMPEQLEQDLIKRRLVNLPFYRQEGRVFHLMFLGVIPDGFEMEPKAIEFMMFHLENTMRSALEISRISKQLYKDELTGLYNVKMLNISLKTAFKECQQLKEETGIDGSVAVLFIDLDHFKQVNDSHGHIIGSKLLVEIAQLFKKFIRDRDTLMRYGGDEYVIICPKTNIEEAFKLAEHIRVGVEKHSFMVEEGLKLSLTTSIGVASYPEQAKSIRQIVELADYAMYEAKRKSRNAVYKATASLEKLS